MSLSSISDQTAARVFWNWGEWPVPKMLKFSCDSDQRKGLRIVKYSKLCQNCTNVFLWGLFSSLEKCCLATPSGVCLGQLLESWWVGLGVIKGGEKRAIEWSLQLLITQPSTPLSPLGDKQVSTSNQKYTQKNWYQSLGIHSHKNITPYLCTQESSWVVSTIAITQPFKRQIISTSI